ncbi:MULTISPECIES: hypothetical protein [unclassified Blastococcus]
MAQERSLPGGTAPAVGRSPAEAGQRTPDGLPQLEVGAHRTPEQGACLMEYVSVLAGTPFGDHSRCTDPALAALARLVNDATSDEGRPALARLAPDLAAAAPAGPRGTATVVLAAVDAACAATGEPAVLVRVRRRAQRRLARVTGTGRRARLARRLDPVHRTGPARNRLGVVVARLAALPGDRRDAALRETLAAAVAALPAPTGRVDSGAVDRVADVLRMV